VEQQEEDQVEQQEEEVNHHSHLVGITPSSRTCTQRTAGDNEASKQLRLY
jgi:hypothetical protein